MAFFSSLGPVLKSFDLVQKLQFRSRVLAVAMDIQNMYPRPNSSSTNDTTDNEAQCNYGTQPTYDEEYVPRMYHRPNNEAQSSYRTQSSTQSTYEEYVPRMYLRQNNSSTNERMDNETYRTQPTYEEYVPQSVSRYETQTRNTNNDGK